MFNPSLRIAFLTPEYVTEPKFDGGLANYLSRVTAALRERGHAPEVFVLSDRDEELQHQGIPVHRVRTLISRRDAAFRKVVKRATGISLYATVPLKSGARTLVATLMRRHREKPFDVVQGSDYGATGLFVPRRRDFPFVTRLSYYRPLWREMSGLPTTIDCRWSELLERKSVQRSDVCYGPSRRIAEVVRRELSIPVEVMPPPIASHNGTEREDDTVLLTRIGDRSYVLFFGRVCRIKGVDLLAAAMRPLLEQDASLHLVIVGREDPAGIVDEHLRTALGAVAQRLIHIGRISHAQLFPIIRRAKAVALPSRIDNFPNVCIEAMRLGQVVIGTREASFDELIVDGESGFLASCESVPSITAAVRRALALTGPQRQSMEASAREKLQEFSPEVTMTALCDFYRRAIAAHGG